MSKTNIKRTVEPVRKSILDIIRRNLRAAGRSIYITRVIYIGNYTGTNQCMQQKMESVIKGLQSDYTNISISGLFLVYPQYFIHVLEAPEDIIYRHFKALEQKTADCEVLRSVFLPTYHHVHQRFFTGWFHVFTIPPSLLQKIRSKELEDIQQHLSTCFTKVYSLCDYISNTTRDHSVPMKEVIRNVTEKIASLYPESTLLEYLLNVTSPVLLTVDDYLQIYSTVPFINLYSDSIWPPPHDFLSCTGLDKEQHTNIVNLMNIGRMSRRMTK